ncbi:hypothetical protein [Hymenobacter rubidus]|uniref:hypothetical protein n=1 Tax=Hymenobacter rubidus TaxID=1441626 RepID=UPI00191E422B|nr:hypothetical protein [Hymenobacter rubidus]
MAQTTPNLPSVAAQPLLELSQPALPGLVGYTAVYYHWADGLGPVAVAAGRVVGDLVSSAGFQWQELPLTQHTIKLTETSKESRHGSTYQVKLQGERPQAVANVLGSIDTLARRPLVLLVRQHDGQLRLVGSAEEPLRLLPTGTGQHPGTRAGLDVLFSGLTTRLAPFYTGALRVGGANAAATVGSTGSVRVLDGRGNVRAVVPAGYDVVIEGPFRTDVRVQPA